MRFLSVCMRVLTRIDGPAQYIDSFEYAQMHAKIGNHEVVNYKKYGNAPYLLTNWWNITVAASWLNLLPLVAMATLATQCCDAAISV